MCLLLISFLPHVPIVGIAEVCVTPAPITRPFPEPPGAIKEQPGNPLPKGKDDTTKSTEGGLLNCALAYERLKSRAPFHTCVSISSSGIAQARRNN